MEQNHAAPKDSHDAYALNNSSERILQFLSRVTSELGTSLDSKETLSQLCHILSPDLAEHCSIWGKNSSGIFTELKKPNLQAEISDLIEIEVLKVVRSGVAVINKKGAYSLLCVPMKLKNEITGIITLINFHKEFEAFDLRITEELAQRAAMVLDHAKVYEDLKAAEAHLKVMREQADSASYTKSLFLANMSHEIRTPLSAILGFLDLILSNQAQTSAQDLDLASRVHANGNHLLRLIDQILDLSKIESGKIEIFTEKVNFGEILKEAYNTLIFQAQNKSIDLTFQLESAVPEYISTDPTRLKQILINMIGNAIKFTDHGQVLVVISYRPEVHKIHFVIKDTGVGLTAEQKERIFKPFTQGDASHTKRFGGTGLGLALSKKFALHMNGDIKLIESVHGQGTTFLVTIDAGSDKDVTLVNRVWEEEDRPRPRQVEEEVISLEGVRVLVAEDSVDNQMIIKMILTKAGALVDIASEGLEAFQMAQEKKYDVILMDIQLPLMSGHVVCQKLRQLDHKGPIIALTAHALKQERDLSLSSGCNAHLTKPIDKKLLLSTIKSFLHLAYSS